MKKIAWQTLASLRTEYEQASSKGFEVHLVVAHFVDSESAARYDFRVDRQTTSRALLGTSQTQTGNRLWHVEATQEREEAILYGDTEAVKTFERLGKIAGACLPVEFRPDRPFHPFTGKRKPKKSFSNFDAWVSLVFQKLFHGGMCASLRFEKDWPKPGCRIVKLTIDPFYACSLAIDTLIEETESVQADDARRKRRKTKVRKVEEAIGVQTQQPDWTIRRVAQVVGCSREYLSRNKDFQKWRKGMKEALAEAKLNIPHGEKDRETGKMAAWRADTKA